MHELAITQDIVDLVVRRVPDRRVVAVRVRVGRFSGVVPEAMEFCFDLAATGTRLEGARLDLERVPGRVACRSCGQERDVPDPLLLCPCGSTDVAVVTGEELTVSAVELEKEATCA